MPFAAGFSYWILRAMKLTWREEVRRFREWAGKQENRAGWELSYKRWDAIHEKVDAFMSSVALSTWTPEESNDILFVLAKSWDSSHFSCSLRQGGTEIVFHLAQESLKGSEWDARWQLAELLAFLPDDARTEPLLLRLVDDENEYVRRRSLQELARIGSKQVGQLALREWHREDEMQEYARMMALSCWRHIQSPLLESHLREAEASSLEYLPNWARRVRNGEVEPLLPR